MQKQFTLLLGPLLLLHLEVTTGQQNAGCSNCIVLTDCKFYLDLVNSRKQENFQIVREAQCGFEGKIPKVCCPNEISDRVNLPVPGPTLKQCLTGSCSFPDVCGEAAVLDKVVGGSDVPIATFTWMAAFGYIEKGFRAVEYMCGGSLINDRYVLTAAHCVDPKGLLRTYDLSTISLGDWNLKTDPDCEEFVSGDFCTPPAIHRKAEHIAIHEDFGKRGPISDDIALIRLDSKVTYSGFVQPICLPSQGIHVRSSVQDKPVIVAGWGITETGFTSDILKQLEVPFVDIATCNSTYQGQINDHQICFGGEHEKDSCNGDSGGPLILSGEFGPPYIQIGIVSFGPPVCGIKKIPAVYTSVTKYRDWIESKLV